MRAALIAAAISLVTTAAHAQSWMYSPGANGAAPFQYSAPTYPQPSYPTVSTFQVPDLPSTPRVESYIPQPPRGPANYPCTMPGCD